MLSSPFDILCVYDSLCCFFSVLKAEETQIKRKKEEKSENHSMCLKLQLHF